MRRIKCVIRHIIRIHKLAFETEHSDVAAITAVSSDPVTDLLSPVQRQQDTEQHKCGQRIVHC